VRRLLVLLTLVGPAWSLPVWAAEELTVGSVARGILKAQEPGVVEAWRAALKDPRPEIRAAAGRAVTIALSRGLGPVVLEALASETDDGVVDELARAAVVLHPESQDAELVSRVRSAREANALARALLRVRGASALVHLPPLRKAGFTPVPTDVDGVLGEPGAREWLAREALDHGDADLWRAVLRAGGVEGPILPSDLLLEALRSSNDDVRTHTLSDLVERAARRDAIAPAVRSAWESTVGTGGMDTAEAMLRELLRRALGSPAQQVPGWAAHLSAETVATVYSPLLWSPTLGHFTRAEREALSRLLDGKKDGLEER
jgi:hypothetical protein